MANFEKIPVEQAIRDAREEGTYLINGYDDEQKWRDTQVPGAISFMDFQQQKVGIPKESELIFYCAWPEDATAVRRAQEATEQGFTNVKVARGGYEALAQQSGGRQGAA